MCYISERSIENIKKYIKSTIRHFFLQILRQHFQNSFVPIFCYVFYAKLQDRIQKWYWKPNTSVLFSKLRIFNKKKSIFGHFCCLVALFLIFLQFFQGFRSMSGKMWFIQVFWLFKNKSNIFILRVICKKNTMSFYCNPGSAPLYIPPIQIFLAAQSSSRSLVVCRSVRPSVHLCEIVTFQESNSK